MIYVGYSFPYYSGLFWVSLLMLQIDGSTERTVIRQSNSPDSSLSFHFYN
ncbi:hypothetical protein HanRHA438_Chr06g0285941 [Helianthus annuus]|nr:hypothetical protein HanOQP8_Chr06g0235041 [Helianthus annuus]KAJ0913465.1 hypothetical protein HanRHA438_Chr06g0285941 [Helianthus annuus]